MDVIGEFFDACCVEGDGCIVSIGDLYAAYQEWCEKNHIPATRRMSKPRFGQQVEAKGMKRDRLGGEKRTRIWRGLRLEEDIPI
jgi:putative DNA primase/helicase